MVKDKVVVVTGASRGCGKTIAERFVKEGAKVAILGSSEDIYKTEKELKSINQDVLGIQADVTKEEDVRQAFNKVLDQFQKIDILINNAGIGFFKLVEETTLEEWQKVFNVNVQGTFLCSKAVLPHMKDRQEGTIITMSSDVGRRTIPNGSAYTSTKYAVQGFCGSLSQEVREYGIRVGTVNPGAIDTFFAGSPQGESFKEDWLKTENIAEAVYYMATAPKHMVVDEIVLHPLSQDYTLA